MEELGDGFAIGLWVGGCPGRRDLSRGEVGDAGRWFVGDNSTVGLIVVLVLGLGDGVVGGYCWLGFGHVGRYVVDEAVNVEESWCIRVAGEGSLYQVCQNLYIG